MFWHVPFFVTYIIFALIEGNISISVFNFFVTFSLVPGATIITPADWQVQNDHGYFSPTAKTTDQESDVDLSDSDDVSKSIMF